MIKNLPQIVLLNIVGLALFLSWYIPVNHGFWLPIDADIFYFFNPCSPEHFEEILENIVRSIEENFRIVNLILYYAADDYLQIVRDMGWKQKRLIKLPNYAEDTDEKMYIFQNPL